jgi:hypothetical protein
MAFGALYHSSCILFPQLLSQGSVDVPVLLAKVTWAQEVATATEATRVTAMLAAETSTREAVAVWDGSALCVNDAEDCATLAVREALERVSRAEAENAATLASTHEDAKGFVRKITLLEDELIVER